MTQALLILGGVVLWLVAAFEVTNWLSAPTGIESLTHQLNSAASLGIAIVAFGFGGLFFAAAAQLGTKGRF